MGGELKEKVAQGVAWSMAEKIGSMLLAMAVRLVILRLLTRDILGFMSIPSAVVTVLLVIVDSGFSQSLVRHKGPSQSDYKSVFLFNIAVSAVLYGVLVALAPLAARWYGMPEIARIAPVFFLLLPLNALCAVQNTIFIRQFRFALLSKVTFLSSLAGGLTAIALAMAGWGIWSLVAERVIAVGMRTALLWWLSDWRPCGKCGLKPLREMAPFGCSLMVTDLISNFYNKIPQFFLGKLYSPAVLGSFDQAVKLKDMPAATGIQAVQNVTFPALAKIRDDAPRFAEGYRQVVMVVSCVMFPIMLGRSAVARDMFAVLLGEEWMPTVPYFEAVCLAGLFSPIALTAYNVLKARCKGPLIVRLEVVKKIIMTAIFAVTIPHSVMAVVWGLVAIAFCEMAVNFLATTRFTSLTFRRFVRTLLPVALVSGTMYLLVRLTAAAWLVSGLGMPYLFAFTGVYMVFYTFFGMKYINYPAEFGRIAPVIADDVPEPLAAGENIRTALDEWIAAKGYVRPGLSLESLAREVGCNRSYLSRYVNSELGLNFKSWIRALRIAESQRLLLEHPGASALEVGEMVGIHGRSTFFAQFSEVTGMSPGEYRRRYAGGDPIAPSQE